MEALDNSGLVFQFREDGLSPDDNIPYALTCDTVILCYFSQGEILVVVEIIELLLTIGKHIAVKIIQKRHTVGLIFHGATSFAHSVKFINFTTLSIILYFVSFVKRTLKNSFR